MKVIKELKDNRGETDTVSPQSFPDALLAWATRL